MFIKTLLSAQILLYAIASKPLRSHSSTFPGLQNVLCERDPLTAIALLHQSNLRDRIHYSAIALNKVPLRTSGPFNTTRSHYSSCDRNEQPPQPMRSHTLFRDRIEKSERPSPNLLCDRNCTPAIAENKNVLQHSAEICNFKNQDWSDWPSEITPRPPGPQPKVPTHPKTSFKLVPIIKTPQTTPKPSNYIGFKPKFLKNFRNTHLIKNPTKTPPNDLKFCTHIQNHLTKLLQLSEFHSDPRIKISPTNRNSPKY